MGTLSESLMRAEYDAKVKRRPDRLFAHNTNVLYPESRRLVEKSCERPSRPDDGRADEHWDHYRQLLDRRRGCNRAGASSIEPL